MKITKQDQPCPKCGIPVVKKVPKHRKFKERQKFYYKWYLFCPGCGTPWMVNEAKVYIDQDRQIKHLHMLHEQMGKVIEQLGERI